MSDNTNRAITVVIIVILIIVAIILFSPRRMAYSAPAISNYGYAMPYQSLTVYRHVPERVVTRQATVVPTRTTTTTKSYQTYTYTPQPTTTTTYHTEPGYSDCGGYCGSYVGD